MAVTVAAWLGGCTHPVERGLRSGAEADRVPETLRVTYDDHHRLWGGRRITVRGDGRVVEQRWRPGQPTGEPEAWRGEVDPARLVPLVELLVRIEAWEQRTDVDDLPRLDEGRARLTVAIGDERSTTWEWANDLEANRRLVRVRDMLETVVARARTDR